MRKILLFITLGLLTSSAFCVDMPVNIKESHSYTTFGIYAPIPIPSVGVGIRNIEMDQGLDLSIDVGTILVGTFGNARCKYIKYYNNNYISTGVKGTMAIIKGRRHYESGYGVAPEITFGKDNKSTFHQINLSIPTYIIDEGLSYIPVISYQYGLKF